MEKIINDYITKTYILMASISVVIVILIVATIIYSKKKAKKVKDKYADMKRCSHCGAYIDNDSKFCKYCGGQVNYNK